MSSKAQQRLPGYHDRVRRRGVQPLVYWSFRALAKPSIQLCFRLRRGGRHHIPEGAVILASNHRSFLDPFVIGCCLRRPIYFVAKKELFHIRLVAWFLNCLGAFPVRRGGSGEESVKLALCATAVGMARRTARARLRRGRLGRRAARSVNERRE
ncbi:MAG: 1-acyl-sn-glycerol-3-phosphate acyltransferase [Thermoleophilaceae bacterium]|nr:1-acyl-sn-glycerol-3-phosphate acyltransferase [Thermoleophilaceae bacterium]